MASEAAATTGVTVRGEGTLSVTPSGYAERFHRTDRRFTIRCHSGRVIEGRWQGVALAPLVEAATFPPGTTHLRVRARDGYAAAIPVLDATGAFLGFDRLSVAVAGEGDPDPPGTPRFLAPDLDSTQFVRTVDSVEAIRVPPGEDPDAVAQQ